MKRLLPLLLPLFAVAQSGPVNLGYEEGTAGQVPPGWLLTTPDFPQSSVARAARKVPAA